MSYFVTSCLLLQYVPPDLCICTFVLEQSLSVRALQEMLAKSGQNSEGVSDGHTHADTQTHTHPVMCCMSHSVYTFIRQGCKTVYCNDCSKLSWTLLTCSVTLKRWMGNIGPWQWPWDPGCPEVQAPMNINEDEVDVLELLELFPHVLHALLTHLR